MAYDPLTGRYTPDKALTPTVTIGGAQAGYKPAGAPNFITGAGIPEAAPAPKAAPYRGFRAAEDESNIGAPVYTPSSLAQTGEFVEENEDERNTEDATQKLLLQRQIAAEEEAARRDRQSAYDILYGEFNKYGLGGLVEDIKGLIESNLSPSQFSIELQNRPAYQARFSANKERIAKGLRALSPAEYIGLEDQYQNVMRTYGLPASYYAKDTTGKQVGFDKFLEGDVSAAELEDRVITAQQRVLNSNPEVLNSIKSFYGDSITNGDILAYALDPSKALTDIKRKVTAAEIQGAANVFGLNRITAESTPDQVKALEARAQALAGYGVDKAAATEGFAQVAEIAPRGSQLAEIYKEQPYTQATAESEIFRTTGAAEARAKRKKLTALEQASFGGASGVGTGALSRDQAGNI
jgi:hypothetical protein